MRVWRDILPSVARSDVWRVFVWLGRFVRSREVLALLSLRAVLPFAARCKRCEPLRSSGCLCDGARDAHPYKIEARKMGLLPHLSFFKK